MTDRSNAPIRYVCRNPDHVRAAADRGRFSVHEREWAYCAADEASGHEWLDVGGVSYEEARRLARGGPPEGPPAPDRPPAA